MIHTCTIFRDWSTYLFENVYLWSLKICNGQSHPYCSYLYGKIYQNTKGYLSHCSFIQPQPQGVTLLKSSIVGGSNDGGKFGMLIRKGGNWYCTISVGSFTPSSFLSLLAFLASQSSRDGSLPDSLSCSLADLLALSRSTEKKKRFKKLKFSMCLFV